MAILIDGRSLAAIVRARLPSRIAKLDRKPGLAVMLIGHDAASELYVRLKRRTAEAIGILFRLQRYDDEVALSTVLAQIDAWNTDPQIDALLVQLPLPRHLREQEIIGRIGPEKDVDGFNAVNTDRYLNGEKTNPPVLIEGIMRLIESTGHDLKGLEATVVARRGVFSSCLVHALAMLGVSSRTIPTDGGHRNATITSDIIVVAAGKAGLIVGEDIKPNAIVIDVGINTLQDGSVVGDVDAKSVLPIAGWLTPVPGGVGPMTIAMLLENVVRLAEQNQA